MEPALLIVILIMQAALGVGVVMLLLRRGATVDLNPILQRFDALERSVERIEAALKAELSQSRGEALASARQLREEVTTAHRAANDSVLTQMAAQVKVQQSQLEAFSARLASASATSDQKLDAIRTGSAQSLKDFNDSLLKQAGEQTRVQQAQFDAFAARLAEATKAMETRLDALRTALDAKFTQLQAKNEEKLEQMRATVDEKLQGTLDKRLGESFKQVSERLEQVHKGLGEMQTLATGVGDLKKVLSNVKVRGSWGEVQLGNLLEQIFAPDQYAQNVATKAGSNDRVEFAVKLPGRGEGAQDHVWLAIDAKFPLEDYQRLTEASERADVEGVEAAVKQLELRIFNAARDIRDKYIDPPQTVDFAIMFLPTEGLYAEVLRRAGLAERVRQEFKVVLTGPTTLMATLYGFSMGFKTLAIEKRSSEIRQVLGAVKTEFGKFGEVIGKVQKKIQEASNVIDTAATRSRAIERKLRDVEAMPIAGTTEAGLLPGVGADDERDDESAIDAAK